MDPIAHIFIGLIGLGCSVFFKLLVYSRQSYLICGIGAQTFLPFFLLLFNSIDEFFHFTKENFNFMTSHSPIVDLIPYTTGVLFRTSIIYVEMHVSHL